MTAPEVTINQGRLIGSIGKNDENEVYYMYQGIPYAKPPIGKLRFKASLKKLIFHRITAIKTFRHLNLQKNGTVLLMLQKKEMRATVDICYTRIKLLAVKIA